MASSEKSSLAAQQELFIAMLKAERRHSVFELGCGPGVGGLQFVRAGIRYSGADHSEDHIRLAKAKGLEASVASGQDLPFADRAFSAVWTMNTLLQVPNSEIDDVVRELVRVAAPGAPIAVGLWSGEDEEGLNLEEPVESRRFFSRRSDDTVQRIFGSHGTVETFMTWPEDTGNEPGPGAGLWTQHYQFSILRTPS